MSQTNVGHNDKDRLNAINSTRQFNRLPVTYSKTSTSTSRRYSSKHTCFEVVQDTPDELIV